MNRFLALISVSAVLGITAGVGLLSGAEVPAGATAGSWGAPVAVSAPGINAGEPGVDAAGDGTLYVNAPAGLLSNLPGSPSYVWRSNDQGATWALTPPSLRANFPGGGDSDVAIDKASGKLYMTDLWLGSSTVSFSTDKANTWTANPLEGVVVQDRQWIATTGSGIAYHLTHQIPAGLVVSKSVDGGISYPINTVAATPVDQTGCVCPPGTLIAEGTGATLGTNDMVGFVYSTSSGGVNFARSVNGALTFTNQTVSPASSADTSQAFPVVADAGGGHLAAVWLEVFAASTRVMESQSSNFGQTWSAPVAIVTAGTSLYPWVDAHGSKIAVTMYHNDAVSTPTDMQAGNPWYESYLESNDNGGTWSALQTIDPVPVKTGQICTEGINCTGNRELLDFQSVTIDANGLANAAYTRSVDNVSTTVIMFVRQTAAPAATAIATGTARGKHH
jgi:hypothetical protein